MKNTECSRSLLALALILSSCFVPVFAQTQSKDKTSKRGLKVTTKQPAAGTQHQGGAAQISTDAAAETPELVVQLPQVRVDQIALSPDGRFALSCGGGTLLLWHVATGKQLRRFAVHSGVVTCIAFSPDGRFALSGGDDRIARLWDIATGTVARQFVLPEEYARAVISVALSLDGRFVLTGSDVGTVTLWNAATGQQARVFDWGKFSEPPGCVRSVAISPDGRYVLAGIVDCRVGTANGCALLWDAATGKLLRRFDGFARLNYSFGAHFVAFSPDSRSILLSMSSERTSTQLLELATGTKVWESSASFSSAAFSPDGKSIATASFNRAYLLDAATGKEVRSFYVNTGTVNFVNAVAFTPDGRFLLTGFKGNALLWDLATGEIARRFEGHSNYVSSTRFSPDGRFILAEPNDPMSKERAVLWDTGRGSVARTFELDLKHSPINTHPVFSPDGRSLLTSDSRLWDLSTGNPPRSFKQPRLDDRSFAFSPDGRLLLISDTKNRALLLDVATGQELRRLQAPFVEGRMSNMNSVAFSPDGRFVVSGSDDFLVRLWDVATGSEVRRFVGHTREVIAVAFSPDGRLVLSSGPDRTARLWDAASGNELRRFDGHTKAVSSVAVSPDAQYVLTGGLDGTARLWNLKTGEEVRRLEGHSAGVNSVGFSPDGRFVLTGAADYTARLWDTATGRELCRLISFRHGGWVVVNPEGRFDTSNLDEINDLHWVMPDDPFTPLPLEIFMREYYEPRLLQRILAGEALKPVKSLSQLNRVLPKVTITNIQSQQNPPDTVKVTVEVSKAKSEFQRRGKKIALETGVYDLRLFRDGQLVGYAPDTGGEIKLDSNTGKAVKTFDVKLPRKAEVKQVEFSAYAFNVDRVKSPTDRKRIELASDLIPVKGRAYVVTIGVNAYETANFDLSFAANDARRVQSIVFDRLAKGADYEEIVQVPLISDYEVNNGRKVVTEKAATKNNLKIVLDLLSGKQVPGDLVKAIPGADRIRQARPEDLILISFSSHGFADDNGNFYFVPYDTGQVTGQRITDEFIRRCVSSDELSLWLRDVDAGDMVMIVDACHSAATVDVEGFKPGPMGSRGLGQLAYDKRMRILTSTQADDVALESGLIKQGLLTYALTHDGIEAGQADFRPKDKTITLSEWLRIRSEPRTRVVRRSEERRVAEFRASGRKKRFCALARKDEFEYQPCFIGEKERISTAIAI